MESSNTFYCKICKKTVPRTRSDQITCGKAACMRVKQAERMKQVRLKNKQERERKQALSKALSSRWWI